MFFTQLLKCQHCSHPYEEYYPPRIMPCCGKTICRLCVQKIERETSFSLFQDYKCGMCQDENFISDQGFWVNEAVAALIKDQPKEIYRGEEAEKLKKMITALDDSVNSLLFEMNNSDFIIREQFSELRRQVVLTKDEKIHEIEKHTNGMIERINAYEQDCIQKYSKIKQSRQQADKLVNKINSLVRQQKNYLDQLKIDDREMKASREMLHILKGKIEEKRISESHLMFNNQTMEFEANMSPIDEEFIGILRHEDIAFTVYFLTT